MAFSRSAERSPSEEAIRSSGSTTSVAPERSAVPMSEMEASKAVERTKSDRQPGPRPKAAICARKRLGRPRCETITPLGEPVLPEV